MGNASTACHCLLDSIELLSAVCVSEDEKIRYLAQVERHLDLLRAKMESEQMGKMESEIQQIVRDDNVDRPDVRATERKDLFNLLAQTFEEMGKSCEGEPGSEGDTGPLFQNLYGEQEAIELAAKLMELLFTRKQEGKPGLGISWEGGLQVEDKSDPVADSIKRTAKAIADFLVRACKGNCSNQKLLFKYKKLLSDLFGRPFNIVDAYSEMIRDNRSLINEISDKDVDEIFMNLQMKQENKENGHCGGRFVMLLAMLCQCEGKPVPSNQNLVLKKVLVENPELLLRSDGQQLTAKYTQPPLRIKLADYKAKLEQDPTLLTKLLIDLSTNDRLFRYQLQLMRLYAVLCMGRNRQVTDWLLSQELSPDTKLGLGYLDLLKSIQDDRIPSVYRAAQVQLLYALYIDREPSEVQPHVSLIRCAAIATNDPMVKSISNERTIVDPFTGKFGELKPTVDFTDLRGWLVEFFVQQVAERKAARKEEKKKNKTHDVHLVSRLVMLAQTLLDFGYYHREEAEPTLEAPRTTTLAHLSELLEPLLDLFDGRKEIEAGGDEEIEMLKCRLQIAQFLESVFNCRQEVRLLLAFQQYEQFFEAKFPSAAIQEGNPLLNKGLAAKDDAAAGPGTSVEMGQRGMQLQQFFETPALWESKDQHGNGPAWNSMQLQAISQSLFEKPLVCPRVSAKQELDPFPEFPEMLLDLVRYTHMPLVTKCFSLLVRHFSQRSVMITNMVNTQVVLYPEVVALMGRIQVNKSEIRRQTKWLFSPDDLKRPAAFKAMHSAMDDLIQVLSLGAKVEISSAYTITITQVELEKFQSIMRLLDVHSQILDMLTMPLPLSIRFTKQCFSEVWTAQCKSGIKSAEQLNVVVAAMSASMGMDTVCPSFVDTSNYCCSLVQSAAPVCLHPACLCVLTLIIQSTHSATLLYHLECVSLQSMLQF